MGNPCRGVTKLGFFVVHACPSIVSGQTQAFLPGFVLTVLGPVTAGITRSSPPVAGTMTMTWEVTAADAGTRVDIVAYVKQ